MIEIIQAPEHVAAVRMRGTVEANQYETAIAEIERKLRGHDEIGIFVDLGDFAGMTADAVGRDLQYVFDKMGEMHRFKRVAVITDQDWIETASKLGGSTLSETEVRIFETGDADKAMEWVSKLE